MTQQNDKYLDIKLQLSDSEEEEDNQQQQQQPQPKLIKPPRKQYQMTAENIASRKENLRIGREKKKAKNEALKKQVVIDESEYSESGSESDAYVEPIPRKTKQYIPSNKQHTPSNKQHKTVNTNNSDYELRKLQYEFQLLKDSHKKLSKRKQIQHKTLLIPQQPQQQAPIVQPTNANKQFMKEFILKMH